MTVVVERSLISTLLTLFLTLYIQTRMPLTCLATWAHCWLCSLLHKPASHRPDGSRAMHNLCMFKCSLCSAQQRGSVLKMDHCTFQQSISLQLYVGVMSDTFAQANLKKKASQCLSAGNWGALWACGHEDTFDLKMGTVSSKVDQANDLKCLSASWSD